LLRFVINKQDFFAISVTNIRKAIAAEEQRTGLRFTDGQKLVEFVRDQGDGTSMAVAIEYQPGEQPRINVQTRQNPPQTFLNKR